MRTRRHLLALFALAAFAAAARPSAAAGQQEVRGTVREAGSGVPVEGAMVVLLAGDRPLAQVLTAADGSFLISVPLPGRFELRVDRIGYTSTYVPAFDVAPGATVERPIETGVQPIELAGLNVEGARRCEVRPAEGLATARVWEEARKALAAAAWTAERGGYRFAWTRFVRQLDRNGRRVLGEERTNRHRVTSQPFVSVDIDVLAREGFVQKEGRDLVYAAPDATVLLSDFFLDTHCVALERKRADGETLIGLRFRPVGGRNVPEIEGVLWLEQNGASLRSVEYAYVNIGRGLEAARAGGELHFRALPNGTWIVQEWLIRLPRVREEQNSFGETVRTTVLGYQAEGGIVNQITAASGQIVAEAPGGGGIRGVVTDSLGRPAPGIPVRIQGTGFATVTGSDGRFAFTGLATGTWSVGASHPVLDAVGHAGTVHEVDVERTGDTAVRLRLPSVRQVVLERCGATNLAPDSTALIGIVLDAAGAPVAGAAVRATWTNYRVSPRGESVSIGQTERFVGTEADARGVFALCGVPTSQTVRASASSGDRTSGVHEVHVEDGADVPWIELVIRDGPADRIPPEPQPVLPARSDPDSAWLASRGFHLRRQHALLHRTGREIAALAADSLAEILRLAPRVEVRPRASGRTEFLLHPTGDRSGPGTPEPCPLDFYLNGNLVRQRLGDLAEVSLDGMLDPYTLSGIEVFDASAAPVGRPDGCGAVMLWSFRLRDDRDPAFTGTVTGRVMQLPENQPVADVRVTLEPGGLVRLTDDLGRFDFGYLPPARYRIDAAIPDSRPWSTVVLLRAGSAADVNIEIDPTPTRTPARSVR